MAITVIPKKDDPNPNYKIIADEKYDGSIEVLCQCGKPLTKTNEYGMFCEDFCGIEECKEAKRKGESLLDIATAIFK